MTWDGKPRRESDATLKVFMAETVVFRENQTEKIDEIKADIKEIKLKISKLPCDVTLEKLGEINKLRTMAGRIIFWGFVSLISFAVLWGALVNRVDVNTDRLVKLEEWRNGSNFSQPH